MSKRARHMKPKEKKKGSLKPLYLVFGAIYFAAVIGATVYAQTAYIDALPKATLESVQSREIHYTLNFEAVAQGETITYTVLQERAIPRAIIEKGCKAEITTEENSGSGSVNSVSENSAEEMVITINIESGSFKDGESVNVAVEGKPRLFEQTVPTAAVSVNMQGQTVINTVAQEDGPWGKKYVIRQETVAFHWPDDGGADYVMIPPDAVKGVPIATEVTADYIYDGMEVDIR